MNGLSAAAIQSVWIWSLVIYFVVVAVVALLLTLIVVEARKIRGGVSAIWNTGQRIANNTVHISLLDQTNDTAGEILGSAVGVLEATARIKAHAAECPGCPKCVLGPEWSR